jgi:hypothetical protein
VLLNGTIFTTTGEPVSCTFSSRDALAAEAAHPARVITIAVAIVANFFIWRPYLSLLVSTGVVYCRSDTLFSYEKKHTLLLLQNMLST